MSGAAERFDAAGADGRLLQYFERYSQGCRVYSRELGIGMDELTRDFAQARDVLASTADSRPASRICIHLRRGRLRRVDRRTCRAGLLRPPNHSAGSRPDAGVDGGGPRRSEARVDREARNDEIGSAIEAFNNMADQLQESREKLIHVTRLASWQALARKMAHEVKNSLTPIRLTMEEISARSAGPDAEFLRQAAQIVVDEVTSLEKRVRAFSDFAAEPPVCPEPVDVNSLVEDRVSFLRSAHPEVIYNLELSPDQPVAQVDPDLMKGVHHQSAAERRRSRPRRRRSAAAYGRAVRARC